ncbi:MAG: WYL domain-containing protein [Microthrixaceae bacterium]|nr:WYL domain-containing protein [Microthrixaceae bacterium]
MATAGDPGLEVLREGPSASTVALSVRNPEGLWSWLLSFLDRAEVLEPPEMRDAYCRHLESIVAGSVPDPASTP